MSKKAAVWGASMLAGFIATYLILSVLGIPAERYDQGFTLATTFFVGLLFLIPLDHILKAGILGNSTPRKKQD